MLLKTGLKLIDFLKIPAFAILFAYISLCACYNLGGLDYLFHIKAGEHIATHSSVPSQDVFSFVLEGKKWIDHEWLYQFIVYSIHSRMGLEGLFLFRMIIFSLAFAVLSTFVIKKDWVFGFPLLIWGLKIAVGRFTLRPDNISFLFLVLFLVPFIFKNRRFLFILPFLQILWVNIHGFFFLGPLIILLYIFLGKINNQEFNRDFYNTAKVVFLLCIAFSFLNPAPLATVAYPLNIVKDIFSGKQALFSRYIQELDSPLRVPSLHPFFFSYLATVLVFLCFFRRLNLFYLGLVVFIGAFSLHSLRNMYFFVPVGIVIFADRYSYIKEVFCKWVLKERGFILLRFLFLIFVIVICVKLVKNIQRFPKHAKAYITKDGEFKTEPLFFSQDPSLYPQELIDFIRETPLPARMFNTFNTAAPLLFNFFPQRQVFIDGRVEFYGEDFFSFYNKMLNADQEAVEEAIKKYELDGFIISYLRDMPSPLIKYLHENGFACVYFSGDGIIFVKADIGKQGFFKDKVVNFSQIEPLKIDLLKGLKHNPTSVNRQVNMAQVLYMLEYYGKAQVYLDEILKIEPNHFESNYLLAKILFKKGDYKKALRFCRRSFLSRPSSKSSRRLLARIYIKSDNIEEAKRIAEESNISFSELLKEIKDE